MKTKDLTPGLEVGHSRNGQVENAQRAVVVMHKKRSRDRWGEQNADTVGLAVNSRLDEWFPAWVRPASVIGLWEDIGPRIAAYEANERETRFRQEDDYGTAKAHQHSLTKALRANDFLTEHQKAQVKGSSVILPFDALMEILKRADINALPVVHTVVAMHDGGRYHIRYQDAGEQYGGGPCVYILSITSTAAPSQAELETHHHTGEADPCAASLEIDGCRFRVVNSKPLTEYTS